MVVRWSAVLAVGGALVIGAAAVLTWWFRSDDEPYDVAEVYDRMTFAMTRDNEVLHTVFDYEERQPYDETREVWVDAASDRARSADTYDFGMGGETVYQVIVAGERYWQVPGDPSEVSVGTVRGCVAARTRAITLYLSCYGEAENVDIDVAFADFDGNRVLAVRTHGSPRGIDSRLEVDDSVYIDPESWLPIATKHHLWDSYGGPEGATTDVLVSYDHEFIDADSLPPDYFDPASLRVK